MENLTLPLALESFIPVALAAAGSFFVARMVAQLNREGGVLALVGFGLITLGGLSQALWKLLLALTGVNLAFLNHGLFILLAPGFVCLAWAIWNAFRSIGQTPIWVVPVIVIAVAEGAAAIRVLSKGGRGWFFILFVVATVASLLAIALLMREAGRRQQTISVLLFGSSMILILLRAGLVIRPSHALVLAWSEQIISTIGWGAFAVAARQLERAIVGK